MNKHLAAVALIAVASTLAACGGGSSGPTTPPLPPSSSSSAALSTSSTTSVSLPQISSGASASVTLPKTSNAANASLTLTATLPSGAVAPQAVHKAPSAIGGTPTTLGYIVMTVSASVSISSTPAFSFTLNTAPPAGQAYIAFFDVNNAKDGWNIIDGPGTVSGSAISFASQTLVPPVTLQAGDTYVFALVIVPSVVPSPPPNLTGNASYVGTKSVVYSQGFNINYPTPLPTTTPAPITYAVTAKVSTGASPFPTAVPAGVSLADQHISESDVASLQTLTYESDSWLSATSSAVSLYGQAQAETSSANAPDIGTLYATAQVLDQLPETNGATWTNATGGKTGYVYADGSAGVRLTNSDGTYVDTEDLGTSGTPVVWTENADGSGSIVGPYFGGYYIDSVTFSAPSPAPSASPVITIQYNYDASTGPFPPTVKHDTVWYPWTQGSPIAFYNEADSVTTGATLPTSCVSPIATTANDVKRVITTLDTIVGFIETTTLDSYNVNGVPICLVTNDVQNYAYSEQANTPFLVDVSQLGLQIITTDETLVLQNAVQQGGRAANAQSANVAAMALQAHELSTFARQRATRTRAIIKRMLGGAK